MPDEPVGRQDRHDIRVVVMLKPYEYTWLKAEAALTGDSQSSYMRRMLIERMQAVELSKLSPEERGGDTPNPAQNLTSPFGLLGGISDEELVEFIKFFRKFKQP